MTFPDIMAAIRSWLATPLYTIGETEGTIGSTIVVVLIMLATWWFSRLLRKAIIHAFERRGAIDPDEALPYARMVQITTLLVGFTVAFNTMGFDLTAVFAAGGLFAVAIGFGMKNIAENFVSGLIMRAERSIKRGDILEVEDEVVTVKDVGIRYTLALNRDDEDLLIPNSILVQSMVTNRTLRGNLFRLRTMVGVSYSSDMKRVRDTLERVARDIPTRSFEEDPVVLMRAFGTSSVDWEVSIWIEDAWRVGRHLSQLNEAIWWGLKEAGIVIAFPQVDVHFDSDVTRSLEGLRRAG